MDEPLASDQLDTIEAWVNNMREELNKERISVGELIDISTVHDIAVLYNIK